MATQQELAFLSIMGGQSAIYVNSREGSDNNRGVDAGSPKKTLSAAIAACSIATAPKLIIAEGDFVEDIAVSIASLVIRGENATLTGDILFTSPSAASTFHLKLRKWTGGNATNGLNLAGTSPQMFFDVETISSGTNTVGILQNVSGSVLAIRFKEAFQGNIADFIKINNGSCFFESCGPVIDIGTTGTRRFLNISASTGVAAGIISYIAENGSGGTFTGITNSGGTNLLTIGGPYSSDNVGSPVTGVTETTLKAGNHYITTLSLSNVNIGAIAGAANEAIGARIWSFPAGKQSIKTLYMSIGLTGDVAVAADTPDVGIGSVIATGAVAVLGGTATFENYVTGQTAPDCAGTAVTVFTAPTAGPLTGIALNGPSGVKDVFLNIADGWAGASAGMEADGTVIIEWTQLP